MLEELRVKLRRTSGAKVSICSASTSLAVGWLLSGVNLADSLAIIAQSGPGRFDPSSQPRPAPN
jgi:hypothetical protein